MAKTLEYIEKTEAYILPILEKKGLKLYDTEFVKEGSDYYLRVYIDKPGGVTIDDCVEVSREMNEILDQKDYIKETYTFEVSSPGLDRPLKKDKDFDRNINSQVELKTFTSFDGQKEFAGILKDYTKDEITITFEDGDYTFLRKDIALIRPAIDF